jgi:glycosyltransferase involved in cell wall biosynthesis
LTVSTHDNVNVPEPDRRVHVVTVVDRLSRLAGAEHLAWLIATRLDPSRFRSTLCVSRWPPDSAEHVDASSAGALEELEASAATLLPLARKRRLDIRAWARLARYLRNERVDVLHTHKFGSNLWGMLAGRIAGVPVRLAHEHTWSYEGQPWRRFIDREIIARYADRLIAVSRADQRRMVAVERIDPARTLFIANGVPPLPPARGVDVRTELGIDADAPVIGVVGVLRPQKAHHILLRATARLVTTSPELRLLIVGGGPERSRIEALVRELGLEQVVLLLGHRTDVADVLGALDVAVSSSDFEGSPLAVMEYMDAARPIAATAVGGVPDLIEDGVHGLLVPPGDPAALADAIAKLLGDRAGARAMGLAARERRRREFDIDTFVRTLEELYRELLAERAPTPSHSVDR